MKNILYILFALALFSACNKSSTSPSYSFKKVMDSLGLQFGKQYAYKHYSDTVLYETGFITFNADSSFIEIRNADTFYYHANIIYTYNPQSSVIYIPGSGSISGEAGGLKYTYYPQTKSSSLLYPGDAFLAWCCYRNDSIKGNPNAYMPFAYYLQKSAPVFLGIVTFPQHLRITPAAATDSLGFPVFTQDKIIIEN
jgi:hypothetical protein